MCNYNDFFSAKAVFTSKFVLPNCKFLEKIKAEKKIFAGREVDVI